MEFNYLNLLDIKPVSQQPFYFLHKTDNSPTAQYIVLSPILNFSPVISFFQPGQIDFREFGFIAF